MERAFLIDSTSEKLVFSKATALHIADGVLHLDELPDATWRLTYSESLISDFSQVQSLRLHGLQAGVPHPLTGVSVELVGTGIHLAVEQLAVIPAGGGKARKPGRAQKEATAMPRSFALTQLKRGGGWQLRVTESLIPDITAVREIQMLRED